MNRHDVDDEIRELRRLHSSPVERKCDGCIETEEISTNYWMKVAGGCL